MASLQVGLFSDRKAEARNYRGRPLLPIVSKVLENIISAQLKQFFKEALFLPEVQFTNRANHSIEDSMAPVCCEPTVASTDQLSEDHWSQFRRPK